MTRKKSRKLASAARALRQEPAFSALEDAFFSSGSQLETQDFSELARVAETMDRPEAWSSPAPPGPQAVLLETLVRDSGDAGSDDALPPPKLEPAAPAPPHVTLRSGSSGVSASASSPSGGSSPDEISPASVSAAAPAETLSPSAPASAGSTMKEGRSTRSASREATSTSARGGKARSGQPRSPGQARTSLPAARVSGATEGLPFALDDDVPSLDPAPVSPAADRLDDAPPGASTTGASAGSATEGNGSPASGAPGHLAGEPDAAPFVAEPLDSEEFDPEWPDSDGIGSSARRETDAVAPGASAESHPRDAGELSVLNAWQAPKEPPMLSREAELERQVLALERAEAQLDADSDSLGAPIFESESPADDRSFAELALREQLEHRALDLEPGPGFTVRVRDAHGAFAVDENVASHVVVPGADEAEDGEVLALGDDEDELVGEEPEPAQTSDFSTRATVKVARGLPSSLSADGPVAGVGDLEPTSRPVGWQPGPTGPLTPATALIDGSKYPHFRESPPSPTEALAPWDMATDPAISLSAETLERIAEARAAGESARNLAPPPSEAAPLPYLELDESMLVIGELEFQPEPPATASIAASELSGESPARVEAPLESPASADSPASGESAASGDSPATAGASAPESVPPEASLGAVELSQQDEDDDEDDNSINTQIFFSLPFEDEGASDNTTPEVAPAPAHDPAGAPAPAHDSAGAPAPGASGDPASSDTAGASREPLEQDESTALPDFSASPASLQSWDDDGDDEASLSEQTFSGTSVSMRRLMDESGEEVFVVVGEGDEDTASQTTDRLSLRARPVALQEEDAPLPAPTQHAGTHGPGPAVSPDGPVTSERVRPPPALEPSLAADPSAQVSEIVEAVGAESDPDEAVPLDAAIGEDRSPFSAGSSPAAALEELDPDTQLDEAVGLLAREAAGHDPAQSAACWLEIARLHIGKGNLERAAAALDESLARDEGFIPSLRVRIQLGRALGDPALVMDALETRVLAATEARDRAAALLRLAREKARQNGDTHPSAAELLEAAEALPESRLIYELQLDSLRSRGDLNGERALLTAREERSFPGDATGEGASALERVRAAHRQAVIGMRAEAVGAVSDAAGAFAAALERDPGCVEGLVGLLRTSLEAPVRLRARAVFARALEPHHSLADASGSAAGGGLPDFERIVIWLEVSGEALALGQRSLAVEALQHAASLAPFLPELGLELSALQGQSADWTHYEATVQRALIGEVGEAARALLLARAAQIELSVRADERRAAELVGEALHLRPGARLLRHEQIRLLTRIQDWPGVVEALLEAARNESSPARVAARFFQAGLVLSRQLASPRRARDCFREARRTAPEQPLFGWTHHLLLLLENAWDSLDVRLTDIEALWPFPERGPFIAGELERRGMLSEFVEQDLERALEFYLQAFESGSRSPIALGGILRLHTRNGDWEALEALYRALEAEVLTPAADDLLRWERSRLLGEKLDQPAAAADLAEGFLQERPFLPLLWEQLDRALEAGRFDDLEPLIAAEESQGGAAADPAFEAAVLALLRVHRMSGEVPPEWSAGHEEGGATLSEWRDAVEDPARLLSLLQVRSAHLESQTPGCAEARLLRRRQALQLERLGDDAGAFERLRTLLENPADEPLLIGHLERLALRLGRTRELLEHLERCGGAVSELSPLMQATRAHALARLGAGASSLAAWMELMRRAPGYPEAAESVLRQADAGSEGGHLLRAQAWLALAGRLRHGPDAADLWFLAGEDLQAGGELEQALDAWLASVEQGLLWEEALDRLVGILVERGDVAGLEQLYALAIEIVAGSRESWIMELGDQLESMGALEQATRAFEGLAQQDRSLPACLRLERLNLVSGAWEALVRALELRAELVTGRGERSHARELATRIRAAHLRDPWALEQQLLRMLEQHPGAEEPFETLRALLASQERWTDLTVLIEKAIIETPAGPRRVRLLLDQAWIYANPMDALEVAFDRYQDVLDASPGEPEALRALREICERRRDWNGMVATLARQALNLHGDARLETYREIARIWDQKLGDPATAADAWSRVLEHAPGDRAALESLVPLYRRLRQWDRLVDAAESLVALGGEPGVTLLNELGVTLATRLDAPERAAPYLLKALEKGEGQLGVLESVASRLEAGGGWRSALQIYEAMAAQLRDAGARAALWLKAAALAKANGELERAGVAALGAASCSDDPRALWMALELQGDRSSQEDALALLQRLLASPRLAEFQASLEDATLLKFHQVAGRLLDAAGAHAQAAAQYEQALELAPEDMQSVAALTGLYQVLGMPSRYGAMIRTLLLQQPDAPVDIQVARYEALAQASLSEGALEEAEAAYNEVRRLQPGQVSVYYRLAEIYAAQGNWNGLLTLYNELIKHATEVGDVVSAYLRKADVLDEMLSPGNPNYVPKAVLHYEKALQYDRGNRYAMLRLAQIALRSRQFQKAAEWLKRILALELNAEELARTHLLGGILCAEAQKDIALAEISFRKAAEACPSVAPALSDLQSALRESVGVLDVLLGIFARIFPVEVPKVESEARGAGSP